MKLLRCVLALCCALLWCHSANCGEINAHGLRLLQEQQCGLFVRIKIINGHEVKLGARPWMALLYLRHNDEEDFACGGTLITDRFVLTAAHCVSQFELVFVRLGEHQLSTELDCRTTGRRRRCTPPVEDVSVERIFKHEDFSRQAARHSDIALLKLAKSVQFQREYIHRYILYSINYFFYCFLSVLKHTSSRFACRSPRNCKRRPIPVRFLL
ncbi:hypothetical protein KR222_011092 [Zaprionus bogoriensis]|nr:hypothetical protein KR222_011092 [Zaprionus bogoriensis]